MFQSPRETVLESVSRNSKLSVPVEGQQKNIHLERRNTDKPTRINPERVKYKYLQNISDSYSKQGPDRTIYILFLRRGPRSEGPRPLTC